MDIIQYSCLFMRCVFWSLCATVSLKYLLYNLSSILRHTMCVLQFQYPEQNSTSVWKTSTRYSLLVKTAPFNLQFERVWIHFMINNVFSRGDHLKKVDLLHERLNRIDSRRFFFNFNSASSPNDCRYMSMLVNWLAWRNVIRPQSSLRLFFSSSFASFNHS